MEDGAGTDPPVEVLACGFSGPVGEVDGTGRSASTRGSAASEVLPTATLAEVDVALASLFGSAARSSGGLRSESGDFARTAPAVEAADNAALIVLNGGGDVLADCHLSLKEDNEEPPLLSCGRVEDEALGDEPWGDVESP